MPISFLEAQIRARHQPPNLLRPMGVSQEPSSGSNLYANYNSYFFGPCRLRLRDALLSWEPGSLADQGPLTPITCLILPCCQPDGSTGTCHILTCPISDPPSTSSLIFGSHLNIPWLAHWPRCQPVERIPGGFLTKFAFIYKHRSFELLAGSVSEKRQGRIKGSGLSGFSMCSTGYFRFALVTGVSNCMLGWLSRV